jgi:hypothetical protein
MRIISSPDVDIEQFSRDINSIMETKEIHSLGVIKHSENFEFIRNAPTGNFMLNYYKDFIKLNNQYCVLKTFF